MTSSTATATVIVDTDVEGPTISRHLYGHFAEHLGRCIYGGFWVGEDSPIPNEGGIRLDVVDALRGNVQSGPRDLRVRRVVLIRDPDWACPWRPSGMVPFSRRGCWSKKIGAHRPTGLVSEGAARNHPQDLTPAGGHSKRF